MSRLLLALGCLVLGACTTSANAIEPAVVGKANVTPPTAPNAPARTRSTAPSIEVLSTGNSPRHALRLAAAVGTTQQVHVEQSGTQNVTIDGDGDNFTLPASSVTIRLEVTEAAGAERTVALKVESATVSPGEDGYMTSQAASLTSGLRGLSRTVTMNDRGQFTKSEPLLGTGIASEAIVLGYVDRNIVSLADPLPRQELGIGAQWRVSSRSRSGDIPLRLVNTYTLTSVSDTEITASVHRRVYYAAGEFGGTTIGERSVIRGEGEAVWPRNGIVGTTTFTLLGTVFFQLSDDIDLTQTINRQVRATTEHLEAPAVVEPATPDPDPNPEPAAPEPAASDPTAPDPPNGAPDTERPGIASNVDVSAQANGVRLTWSPATDNVAVTGYNVYRATTQGGDAELVGSTATPEFMDDQTAAGTYWYYIRAIDAAGNEGWRTGWKSVTLQ